MRTIRRASAIVALMSLGGAIRGAEPFQPDSPLGIVTKLYHDYSYEAVFDQNAPYETLLNEPAAILETYLTSSLTKLILEDRQCAVSHGWGYCHIDFMPMWASQDSTGDLVKLSTTAKHNEIRVTLTVPAAVPGSSDKVDLLYTVVKTRRGWRIDDIRGKGWSLVSTLSSKVSP